MAAIRQFQPKTDLWQAIKELEFISSFFSWLFMLCSRLAEPCMLLATIYIIIEAGISGAAVPALHNLSVAIMIAAPEIILPGAFVVAKLAKEKGEEARPLSIICWLFVTLTLTTLASLFLFHFDKTAIAVIMCARCAVGVGYSILVRMLSHTRLATPNQSQAPQPPALEITPALISMLGEQLKDHFSPIIAETIEKTLRTVAVAPVSTAENHIGNRHETGLETLETGSRDRLETGVKTTRPRPTRTGSTDKTALVMSDKITAIRRVVSDDEVKAISLRLKSENGKVSGDTLKGAAGIGKKRALEFLRSVEERAS